MPTRLTDLDALDPEPRRVKLKGKEYLLPGDLPAPLYLRLQGLAQSAATEAEGSLIEDLYDRVLALFQEHQPDLIELPIGLRQLVSAVGTIYREDGDEPEPSNGLRPTRPRKRTTTPRSRSSS